MQTNLVTVSIVIGLRWGTFQQYGLTVSSTANSSSKVRCEDNYVYSTCDTRYRQLTCWQSCPEDTHTHTHTHWHTHTHTHKPSSSSRHTLLRSTWCYKHAMSIHVSIHWRRWTITPAYAPWDNEGTALRHAQTQIGGGEGGRRGANNGQYPGHDLRVKHSRGEKRRRLFGLK